MTKRLRYQPTNGKVEVRATAQTDSSAKPVGLWYSVGEEWKEWCEAENFYVRHLAYTYELDVDEARILRLTTELDLLNFTARYQDADRDSWYIDWQAVAQDWDGIEIAPYQWGCRMDTRTRWYYGWDVASGCLWRPAALRGAERC